MNKQTPILRAQGTHGTPTIGVLNTLSAHFATDRREIEQVQALRYQVFFGTSVEAGLDADRFDAHCDHLIIRDHALKERIDTSNVVGTYRLMTQAQAEKTEGFYSQSEFDVEQLCAANPTHRFLELGRSCVLPEYRSKRTIELMWHAVWSRVIQTKSSVLFGCASFPGTDLAVHRDALTLLSRFHGVKGNWLVNPTHPKAAYIPDFANDDLDLKSAIRALPPLIKGYLRLGASFSHHAVIDEAFKTTDILVVLPVDQISERYKKYYGEDASRYAV